MTELPWPPIPLDASGWRLPPRDYGILPFWFLDGDLRPDEMRRQLREFRDKGMPGIILHGRYGLEMPYLGADYLDRIRLAIDEAASLGLETWIYDEMNWPSGTADGRVLRERPDLAERYLECVSMTVRGPWFTYLTGADSRYLDFERSTPVAAFAIGENGERLDLTQNLSFGNVIPWEVPPGNWRLMYIVEKRADYYIDALDPEATATFLRLGYEPYWRALPDGRAVQGFYTDEPAMHYFLSAGDNPVVPWTRDMFRRFLERNGYNLRPRLPDLFFDLGEDSARVRYDFYSTLTEFYSDAYYRQIHQWCRAHGVLFTGHLLYEEWLRKMIRVEGNPFKHYTHFDVIGVDHLYPIIGSRDRPDEHVAMKVASSAAHHLRSPRLLCESFGGIFMDATMQRMKWITDWEYVLGVNLLNPHGFHYTLEGPRKRDWPPSMFYQYPWWHYYGAFSEYVSRLSSILTGGRHIARVGIIWPINSMFATYTPQAHHPLGDRTERDFNALTDLLLRLHHDFDYLDEDLLAGAEIANGEVRLGDEAYELLILPPMTHVKCETLDRLEAFVEAGGRVLGMVFLPVRAFGPDGLMDVSERVAALFGIEPGESQRAHRAWTDIQVEMRTHGPGIAAFLRTYAISRLLPVHLQREVGVEGEPENPHVVVESVGDATRYFYAPPGQESRDITAEVEAERAQVAEAVADLLGRLIAPDVTIDNPEIFYLHRVRDGRDVYFLVNPTFREQSAEVTLSGTGAPALWDPSTGGTRPVAPLELRDDRAGFRVCLPPTGSMVVVTDPGVSDLRVVDTDMVVEAITETEVRGYSDSSDVHAIVERDGRRERASARGRPVPASVVLDGVWQFAAEDNNALVIDHWLAREEMEGTSREQYTGAGIDAAEWLMMKPGAWSYQLPAEPTRAFPIPVWYRVPFWVDQIPSRLALIVDGFAGADWSLYVNGTPRSAIERSVIDSQMGSLDITDLVRRGDNILAMRLMVTSPTDGLLDLVKLVGPFSLDRAGGTPRIISPRQEMEPLPWTTQGYPFYSGRGVYRRRFTLPEGFRDCRLFLEPILQDDVLEVVMNGRQVGVRLWPPYDLEVTPFIQPGSNTLELRVANTLINLLEAVERPSGLTGPPRLVARAEVSLPLPAPVAGTAAES